MAKTDLLSALSLSALLLATSLSAAHKLPELPYGFADLEPYIDEQTMRLHWERHHGGQVNGLNAAISDFPEIAEMSIEDIMRNVSRFNTSVRNNGGGHFNHSLFWQIMAPRGKTGEPSAELLAAIERDFGSKDQLIADFTRASNTQFGSGWGWLIVNAEGRLQVTSTPNQDNPLMDIVEVQGIPILGLDVWEHAYYLSYQNRRGAYVMLWWNIVNWNRVSELYADAIAALN
jgi:Fe-Mn family superoxide dismutase